MLIDENDVEASHATSVGSVDENQLFYMQTRGLTKKEVLSLIAVGYLSFITDVIDDEDLKNEFVELLKMDKPVKIKRFINRNQKIFKDDITIVF